jgi:DNA-binding transcriptional LysR family regulator
MAASAEDLVSMVLFARVVEERSFTAAAARLGLSKSAVSAQVARFEARLGTRLLHRTTRRLSLTEAGLELYQRCARIAAEADETAALAEGLTGEVQGTLKVNAGSVLAAEVLAPLLPEFLAQHPGVKVELTAEDRLVDPLHGGYDVLVRGVREGASPGPDAVVARKLATGRVLVCATPAYLAEHGTPQGPDDLVNHHCLRYLHNTPHEEWRFEREGAATFVPVPSRVGTSSGLVLRAAVLAGAGLGVVPSFMVARELASGVLVEVLPEVGGKLGLYALHAGRRHVPPRIRAYVDFLAARLKKVLGVSG